MKSNFDTSDHAVQAAEAVALRAVAFIVADQSYMADFLSRSGASPEHVAELIENHDFLSGVLDHLLANEALMLAFCGNAGIDPSEILPARDILASLP